MSPDNSPAVSTSDPAARFALPGYSVLALDGPDAVAFAQAQFANDLAALAIGHWQWSAWLNAKGRVIAVFALLRTGEASLRLVLPDFGASALGEALRRFVFRRKVTIAVPVDLHPSGTFGAPALARGSTLSQDIEAGGALELDFGTTDLPRTLHLSPLPAPADAAAASAWDVADLRLGLPRLAASQREAWTPQQLGLDRLQAFSVKKGCYPGQEIVARTHFLGKAKRELLLLQVDASATEGTEVMQDGKPIGVLASVSGQAPRWALAVLPLDRGDEPLQAAGTDVVPQPFVEGLAR